MKFRNLCAVMLLIMCVIGLGQKALAQKAIESRPTIAFDSFSATYFLSRDAENNSLLTSQEAILAEFPSSGAFSGITRTIPQFYQNQSVRVKILNITDATGKDIPFKTATGKDKNLVITTGDPSITLYGFQTFKINYQTRNVINLKDLNDEFLLDVNGHGWSQEFGQVNAVIHIPNSFNSSLVGRPNCYIGYQTSKSGDCTLTSIKNAQETVITAKSKASVAAQHSLVVRLQFKQATFSNTKSLWQRHKPVIIIALAAIVLTGVILSVRKFKSQAG